MSIVRPPKSALTNPDQEDAFIAGAPDGEKASGRGLKRGKKEQIAVIIDPDLLDRADAKAKKRGMSRSAYISMCLFNDLDSTG